MDALLPIDNHARAYQRSVEANIGHGKKAPGFRLYEVQNGNHIESTRIRSANSS